MEAATGKKRPVGEIGLAPHFWVALPPVGGHGDTDPARTGELEKRIKTIKRRKLMSLAQGRVGLADTENWERLQTRPKQGVGRSCVLHRHI